MLRRLASNRRTSGVGIRVKGQVLEMAVVNPVYVGCGLWLLCAGVGRMRAALRISALAHRHSHTILVSRDDA